VCWLCLLFIMLKATNGSTWHSCSVARAARYQAREFNLQSQGQSIPQELLEKLLKQELCQATRDARGGMLGNRIAIACAGEVRMLITTAGSHGACSTYTCPTAA
jgi:hypothetical protein